MSKQALERRIANALTSLDITSIEATISDVNEALHLAVAAAKDAKQRMIDDTSLQSVHADLEHAVEQFDRALPRLKDWLAEVRSRKLHQLFKTTEKIS